MNAVMMTVDTCMQYGEDEEVQMPKELNEEPEVASLDEFNA